ncbi:MAG: hypothetical protein PUE33_04000 [bacterium]|nr:hypothetical protein [bacterium]
MKELKVGMYVRTETGIAKIEEITGDRTEIYFNCDTGLSISFIKKDFTQEEMADFYKHSHNIIGLIEVGDYVNGELVVQVSDDKGWVFTEPVYFDEHRGEERHYCYNNSEIKSVVTKEQFNSVKYEVE